MDGRQSEKDLLEKLGKFIAYKQILLFALLLVFACHITYSSFSCPICGPGFEAGCKIFTTMLLIIITTMFIFAFILSLGLSMRQSDYLRPWLVTTVFLVILDIAMISLTEDNIQLILGSLVLICQSLSWFPIYKLYERFNDERRSREEQRPHLCNMEQSYIRSRSSSTNLPYYHEINVHVQSMQNEKPPPSYEEAVNMETPPPRFVDILGWLGASV
ncbi:uncharacterized protein LOC105261493 [Musca domestica]|uniref:Uncharacterized protein LOC105261493 n=1 Tax=Musca domestica TaxID=7370 RepID=A0A1I8NKE7_MUSDO|nr:uncharacterized protein LOC105261493 [Musca domestica]